MRRFNSMDLIGREEQIRVVEDALDRLATGAQFVSITGEPGAGKTALLARLAEMAEERGHLVLCGLPGKGRRSPLGQWIDALDDHLATLDDAALRAAAGRDLHILATVLPALAPVAGPRPAPDATPDRPRLMRALRDLLHRLMPEGLVVAFDDVERANENFVELLEWLLRRRARRWPVLTAIAYRVRPRVPRLDALVDRAVRSGSGHRLTLEPLRLADAELLMDRWGVQARHRSMYLVSGGNPFYLQVLARARQPVTAVAGQLPTEMALVAEIEAASPPAQTVAWAAAVVGERFTPELVADVAGLSEADVLPGIDELSDSDIIRTAGQPRLFQFRHPLVWQAAYQAASPGWRLAAHQRAAAALDRSGAGALERAPHVEYAAHLGDLGAVRLLAAAAAELRPRAPVVEAHWLRTAVRLLPTDGSGAYRLALLLKLAYALGRAGQLRESREVLHEVLPLMPRGSGRARARAISFCSVVEMLLGHYDEASALLSRELEATADSDGAVELTMRLASCELMRGDAAAGQQWARRATEVAQRTTEPAFAADGAAAISVAECAAGNPAEAAGRLDRAVPVLDAMTDDELAERIDAMVWTAWAEIGTDRLGAAVRHLDRVLSVVRTTGQDLMLPYVLWSRTVALRRLGRLPEAARCAADLTDATLSSDSEEFVRLAAIARSWVSLCADETPGEPADLLAGVPGGPIAGWYRAQAASMLGEIMLAQGDPHGCLALTHDLGGPGLPRVDATSRVAWYELLTRAAVAARHTDAAQGWAHRAAVLADRMPLAGCRGTALLARAEALAEVEPQVSIELAGQAAEALAQADMPIEVARARLTRGAVLATIGDHQQAAMELAAAQSMFTACGAPVLAKQAVRQRRRLAGKSRRPVEVGGRRGGVSGLTSREQEVARLVSEGLTNRQIAQQLYVSEKTVEVHLSRVFAKLGASTRSAVAAIMVQAAVPGKG
jgi:DNA-binding CsgD family transcriptional regulator/tetratricopeptide (TPR) repeat protein